MAIYLLQRTVTGGQTVHAGVQALLVNAEDEVDALLIAKGYSGSDPRDHWAAAAVVATAIAAPANYEGVVVQLDIVTPEGEILESVSVTGAAAATVDSIGALLVTALNATSSIAGAAYDAGASELTVAETTDGIGDHRVVARCLPPVGAGGDRLESTVALFDSITDGGASGDALVILFEEAAAPPKVFAAL